MTVVTTNRPMFVELSPRTKRSGERCPKKSSGNSPYRKPTQVDEESILRSSSESWLRN
jgi:hypothetical protein